MSQITAVNLVDSHYCADAAKFIAVMLTSLTVMINLELPAINVLSKIDLIEQFGELRTCLHPLSLDSGSCFVFILVSVFVLTVS